MMDESIGFFKSEKNEIVNTPLMVTIRCITYNHKPYIRQCLEGFVMQNTNFRFEAIVHDDASTDGTAAIIREYAEKYPDIIKPIYETENQYSKHDGSLDRIMDAHMHGKYIALCEGDDYWTDPLKLQKQVDFLENHPGYSMCFHNAVKYYENYNRIELFNHLDKNCDLTIHDAVHKWLVPTASMLLRRSVCINYPTWVRKIYSGDYTLILLAAMEGKIFYIHQIMSVYRINFEGMSASARMQGKNIFMLQQKIYLLESFKDHVEREFCIEVESMLAYLKKELKFQQCKERKNVIGMISTFGLFKTKLLRKVRSFFTNYI